MLEGVLEPADDFVAESIVCGNGDELVTAAATNSPVPVGEVEPSAISRDEEPTARNISGSPPQRMGVYRVPVGEIERVFGTC